MIKARDRVKTELIGMFGGACQVCGYNKCLRALQFHHEDPSTKHDWKEGRAGRAARDEIKAYPERFRLLCANCHFEAHAAIDAAKLITIVCLHCGREVPKIPRTTRLNRHSYCSPECAKHFRSCRTLDIESLRPRFFDRVKVEGECWIWTGMMTTRHLAVMQAVQPDGRTVDLSARRVSYALANGEFPAGRYLTPLCKNLRCVAPLHLKVRAARPTKLDYLTQH